MGQNTSRPKSKSISIPAEEAKIDESKKASVIAPEITELNVNDRNNRGETFLHAAAATGNVDNVTKLLNMGAKVDLKGPQYRTALHIAASEGHRNVVELLLNATANIHAEDAEQNTPLLLAAKAGHADVVKLLIEKQSLIDKIDKTGNSAFVYSAKANSWDIVELLCEHGASPKKYDGDENLPLRIAADKGHIKTLKYILQNTKYCSSEERKKALAWARDGAVVFAFEEAFPRTVLGKDAEWAMLKAAENDRPHTLKALLIAGVNRNAKDKKGRTASILVHRQAECVEVLKQFDDQKKK